MAVLLMYVSKTMQSLMMIEPYKTIDALRLLTYENCMRGQLLLDEQSKFHKDFCMRPPNVKTKQFDTFQPCCLKKGFHLASYKWSTLAKDQSGKTL